MNKERLNKLADFLDMVPTKQFDINRWANTIPDPEPSCGFVACAGGWAATIPEFKEEGLKMVGEGLVGIEFIGHHNTEALSYFFDITWDQACSLFMPIGYPSGNPRPSTVARKIRKLTSK